MISLCVIIPIYKPIPGSDELISIKHTLKTFDGKNTFFICPEKFDHSNYQFLFDLYSSLKITYFNEDYFKNIEGYNRLLLKREFYYKFSDYNYMLIVQPDAYIFSNDLHKWTCGEFDYYGAPWITKVENDIPEFLPFGGNGGVSLRNIKSCIKTLSEFKIMETPAEVMAYFKKFHSGFKLWIRLPLILLRMIGYKNNSRNYISFYGANEDVFWSTKAQTINKEFKPAPVKNEIGFAFERFPEIMYKMNGNKLPFGCHAWEKYNPEFWKSFIEVN